MNFLYEESCYTVKSFMIKANMTNYSPNSPDENIRTIIWEKSNSQQLTHVCAV